MDTRTYDQFLEALDKIVNEDGPVSDKINNLKSHAGSHDLTNLMELAAWLEDPTD